MQCVFIFWNHDENSCFIDLFVCCRQCYDVAARGNQRKEQQRTNSVRGEPVIALTSKFFVKHRVTFDAIDTI